MPVKATPGLDELRSQARQTFRYWPIYLMLRLREVEQHLTPAQRDELGPVAGFDSLSVAASLPARIPPDGRVALLIEYGLLTGEEPIRDISVDSIPLPDADACFFRAGAALINTQFQRGYVSLDFVMRQEATLARMELLRTTAIFSEAIASAAEVFNRMSVDLSAEVAFEAARCYSAVHGARRLEWQSLPVSVVADFLPDTCSANGTEPILPPRRRRGRGIFRTPN